MLRLQAKTALLREGNIQILLVRARHRMDDEIGLLLLRIEIRRVRCLIGDRIPFVALLYRMRDRSVLTGVDLMRISKGAECREQHCHAANANKKPRHFPLHQLPHLPFSITIRRRRSKWCRGLQGCGQRPENRTLTGQMQGVLRQLRTRTPLSSSALRSLQGNPSETARKAD